MSEAPTLEAKGARIDVDGRAILTQLTLSISAERVALLGDWTPLFRLLSNEAELSAGSLELAGSPLPLGVERGAVGVMRLDPALPAAWSVDRLLASSTELCGASPKAARKAALELLEHLGLSSLSGRRVGHLQLAERRALLVAHAALTAPRVVCLEQPLAGLDTHAEAAVLAVIERVSKARRLLVAFADASHSQGSRQLLHSCGERWRLATGVVVTEPADPAVATRHVTATVCQNHQAFAAALSARGLVARPTHEAGILSTLTSPGAGPCWRYLVELPEGSTAPVLDAALEADAGLVELIPLGAAS